MLFVGKLIPLHGLGTILAAAALCPDIVFRVVGTGQLDELMQKQDRERPLGLVGRVREPPGAVSIGDVRPWHLRGVGQGGTGDPEQGVPGTRHGHRPITADTPASRELLHDGRDALLVPAGDPTALADAVRRLAAERDLANALGTAGRTTYETNATEDVLVY